MAGTGVLVLSGGVKVVLVSRNNGKKSAPAATIAAHEQQTRIASMIPKIFGIDEDWALVVSINDEPPGKFCSSYTGWINR
jgi:hypothetical protein